MTAVLIYNAGGHEPLGRVSLQHAIGMIWRGVARVFQVAEGETFAGGPKPTAVELVRYVYAKWKYERTGRAAPSTANVLRRDHYRCAYCGGTATTRDHIIPRARGGATAWENLVAACARCNHKKEDRTPAEAGLRLRLKPYVPTFQELFPEGVTPARR
jgi:hypothetical protein